VLANPRVWAGQMNTRAWEMKDQKPRAYKLNDLVPAGELAKALGVSVDTVLEWRRKGGLPGYRVGKRVFFLEGEVMDWIQENLRIQGNQA